MEYLGNKAILEQYKIGFLCSRKIPADIILKTYDWAIEQRVKGVCIVSGFHSKIEKDVFDILIKGAQPIIMVLARGLKKRWEPKIKSLLDNNRLLIISPFPEKISRITEDTANKRNKVIAEISDLIIIAYKKPGGSIEKIIKELKISDKVQSLNE